MYTLLTGARKNVGDYLIAERAKALLLEVRGDRKIVELSRFHKLDDKLSLLNKSKAVILCGGPAYARDIFPRIYPLVSDLSKLKSPIIPLGLGWNGKPMRHPDRFRFTTYSMKVLQNIHDQAKYTSCRDTMTKNILHRHGFKNVLMTGCPALYDLSSIGQKMKSPKNINHVVVTPPQKKKYHQQCLDLLQSIKKLFPQAHLYCVFHRDVFKAIKTKARQLGYTIVEAAHDVSKIDFYRECDVHVGYRVHAHLYFLSIRKPSFLLHEDGRGIGQSQTLHLSTDMTATERKAVPKMIRHIQREQSTDFESFKGIGKKIDKHYQTMEKFLESLP